MALFYGQSPKIKGAHSAFGLSYKQSITDSAGSENLQPKQPEQLSVRHFSYINPPLKNGLVFFSFPIVEEGVNP